MKILFFIFVEYPFLLFFFMEHPLFFKWYFYPRPLDLSFCSHRRRILLKWSIYLILSLLSSPLSFILLDLLLFLSLIFVFLLDIVTSPVTHVTYVNWPSHVISEMSLTRSVKIIVDLTNERKIEGVRLA